MHTLSYTIIDDNDNNDNRRVMIIYVHTRPVCCSLETFLYVGLPAGWNVASESGGSGGGHGPRVIQPLRRLQATTAALTLLIY